MQKLISATRPTIDKLFGINIKTGLTFFVAQNRIPKVKFVVGQGSPNAEVCG